MVSFAFFPPASALSADDSAVCESAEAASEATELLCVSGCGGRELDSGTDAAACRSAQGGEAEAQQHA